VLMFAAQLPRKLRCPLAPALSSASRGLASSAGATDIGRRPAERDAAD
jgi:hypothetical protein